MSTEQYKKPEVISNSNVNLFTVDTTDTARKTVTLPVGNSYSIVITDGKLESITIIPASDPKEIYEFRTKVKALVEAVRKLYRVADIQKDCVHIVLAELKAVEDAL